MISAFSHKIWELEGRIAEQDNKIKQLVRSIEEQSSKHNETQSDLSNCQQILNGVLGKIQKNSSDITIMKTDCEKMKTTNYPWTFGSMYNPWVSEFRPRTISCSATQCGVVEQPTSGANADVLNISMSGDANASKGVGDRSQVQSTSQQQNQQDMITFGTSTGTETLTSTNMPTQTSVCIDLAPQPLDLRGANNTTQDCSATSCSSMKQDGCSGWGQEISYYKARIQELEVEIGNKDRIIQDLMRNQENFAQRELELVQKKEWYEHKMRLLKQDKRRRGETIGKLLRSIDEMKDSGRLDMSRAVEGKGILSAALATRGLPPEDRIQAAIDITEAERARYREMNSATPDERAATPSIENEFGAIGTIHNTLSPTKKEDGILPLGFNFKSAPGENKSPNMLPEK